MYGSALLSKSYMYFIHYGSVLHVRILPHCIELFTCLRFSFSGFALMYSFFKFRFMYCFVGYVKTSFDRFLYCIRAQLALHASCLHSVRHFHHQQTKLNRKQTNIIRVHHYRRLCMASKLGSAHKQTNDTQAN